MPRHQSDISLSLSLALSLSLFFLPPSFFSAVCSYQMENDAADEDSHPAEADDTAAIVVAVSADSRRKICPRLSVEKSAPRLSW